MTMSNRQAGEEGKLGGDVLALGGAEKAPRDTGEELGLNAAPGLKEAAPGEHQPWTVGDVHALVEACQSEDPAVRRAGEARLRAAIEAPRPDPFFESVRREALATSTRKILDGCSVATATSEQLRDLARAFGLKVGASRETIAEALQRAAADEKIANPWRLVHFQREEAAEEQVAVLDAIGHLSADGTVTILPPGIELQVVDLPWPNPSRVEAGQVWDEHDNWALGWQGCAAVRSVAGDAVDFRCDDDDGPASAAAFLDPKSNWRCVGYELPDRNRLMIGEYRAGDAGNGGTVWRISGVLDGARVKLTSPTDVAVYEQTIVSAESIAKWSLIAKSDDAWRAIRAQSIEAVAGKRFEVRETPAQPGLWSALAKHFMFRQFASRDSDGAVPLLPDDPLADYAYRWSPRSFVPTEYTAAPGQVGYLFTGCMDDAPPEGPTMRAEAAVTDVSPAEHDRSKSPPSADCGPSPRIDAHGTPGRRAMAEQGWIIRDEPHE